MKVLTMYKKQDPQLTTLSKTYSKHVQELRLQ